MKYEVGKMCGGVGTNLSLWFLFVLITSWSVSLVYAI